MTSGKELRERALRLARQRSDLAETVATDALECSVQEQGMMSREAMLCMHLLGMICRNSASAEKHARGLAYEVRAADLAMSLSGLSVDERVLIVESAAVAAQTDRDHALAARLAADSVELQRFHVNVVDPDSLGLLVDSLVATGRSQEALPLAREWLAATTGTKAFARFQYAQCLLAQAEYEQAAIELRILRSEVTHVERLREVAALLDLAERRGT